MMRQEFTRVEDAARYATGKDEYRPGCSALDALADLLMYHAIGDGFVMVEGRKEHSKFVVYKPSKVIC
jgi:tRNA splicing endonuclease